MQPIKTNIKKVKKIRALPLLSCTTEYITGTSLYFYMVALAGWWNTPTFSPIGVLSAFYDGNLSVSNASDWTR